MKFKKSLAALLAGALTASAMVLSIGAADIDAGILKFNDRDFTVKGMDRIILGEDPDKYSGWDAIYVLGRNSEDTEKMIAQNYNVWKNVSKVTASFYLEDADGTAFAEDMGFIQTCGVMGEGANWQWFQNDANLLQQNESFEFGSGCVMTATWDVADYMAKHGKDVENGGVLKLSMMIGNDGIDDFNLKIVWTDVSVEGDQAAMDEAVASVLDFGAATVDDSIEAEENALTEAVTADETVNITAEQEAATVPAAGNTSAAATASKGSADTGIQGAAVVIGLAVIGTGAVIVSRKKSK